MAEAMIKVRAKIAHCAGGGQNVEVGEEYLAPESAARARSYSGLVEVVAHPAAASVEAEKAPDSRDPGPPVAPAAPATNQETQAAPPRRAPRG